MNPTASQSASLPATEHAISHTLAMHVHLDNLDDLVFWVTPLGDHPRASL